MQIFRQSLSKTKPAKLILLVGLAVLLFAYTIPWVAENSGDKDYSGIDFHGYWYAGHYVRAGVNSYAAILNGPSFPIYWDPRIPGSGVPYRLGIRFGDFESALKLPIYYLDGRVVTDYPVAQVLIVAPSATAPLGLFLGLFSWFSWNIARTIWIVLNIIFAALIPWLGMRLIDQRQRMNMVDQLILAMTFYNFYGLRQSTVVGQQTLICLFLLMLALLLKDRWLVAGILLGFGISKYSVGLPVFLFFLLQRKYRIILVGLIVQAVGLLLLMPLEKGSLLETVKAYLKVFDLNYSQTGVHLLAQFAEIPLAGYLMVLVILVVTIYLVGGDYLSRKRPGGNEPALQLNHLNILTLGVFLAAYHRIHDMPFMIFFFLATTAVLVRDQKPTQNEGRLITASQWLLTAMLVLPNIGTKVVSYAGLPAGVVERIASADAISTLALLVMFALSAWFQLAALSDSKPVTRKINQTA